MIKLVYCITRRHGMALEEFSRYWREVHGPIGRRIPGLRRLVQSHPTRQPADLSPPPFDGMAELWFDDLAALEAARRSPEWRASSADEAHFIDGTRTALFLTGSVSSLAKRGPCGIAGRFKAPLECLRCGTQVSGRIRTPGRSCSLGFDQRLRLAPQLAKHGPIADLVDSP